MFSSRTSSSSLRTRPHRDRDLALDLQIPAMWNQSMEQDLYANEM